jgi:hypothetical protein
MKGRSARASGGGVEEGVKVKDSAKGADFYAGGNSNTAKEAKEPTGFKKGGKVSNFGRGKESEGMKIAEKMKMKKKDGGCAMGDKSSSRLDRPKRASGGSVASGSRSPFSKAESTSERPDFKGMRDIAD